MALISPGVEVKVSDESQYTPTAAGTVAYVLIATAQDKKNASGATAPYTTKAAAGKLQGITSQRDLVQKFGSPAFQTDSGGNSIHGDERNEYGLLAAYSALGVSNRVYVQRADVDLAQLAPTGIRPTGEPADGTYWLDLTNTQWGIYEWGVFGNQFTLQNPRIIDDVTQLNAGVPLSSVGLIGEYAVVAVSSYNPIYYKNANNNWVLVGSDNWTFSVPTITGAISNPGNLSIGDKLVINHVNVTATGTTVSAIASDINSAGIIGVRADVTSTGDIRIYCAANATSNGSTIDGQLTIAKGSTIGGVDCAVKLGLFDSQLDGASNIKTLLGPTVQFSSYVNAPAWKTSDDFPRPYGSVWFKTSAVGNGTNISIKEYNSNLQSWVLQTAPVYSDIASAIYGLDKVGGGAQIPVGQLFAQYDTLGNQTATLKLFRKNVTGKLKVTGSTPSVPLTFVVGNSFRLLATVPGTSDIAQVTITLTGTSAASLVSQIQAANLPNVSAAVEASGAISLTHLAGGSIAWQQLVGTPLATAGLNSATHVREVRLGGNTFYQASPFAELTYTYSFTAPYTNPKDGTLWYYSNPLEVDIMISDGSGWKGYRNVGNDARGYNLVATDPAGPILSASRPITQSDGSTPLAAGDLWVDTNDLENYPVIYRFTGSNWVLIDNTDNIGVDGIVFADARWGYNGTTDPIVHDLPKITDLLTSNYIDDDCPDYRLYPRGSLLFNTRRSGFNVKRFESKWFDNPDAFAGTVVPEVKSVWVTHSGVNSDGVPYFGHKAQRNTVVEAMKAAIESSTELREEQTQFNLIVCPGYPELIQNMIALNNDRKQTAFIIGDSPLDLTSSNVEAWSKNTALALDNGEQGLVSTSEYLAVYYPSGFATNLDGNSVVVPASHIMLRTYIRSDNVSYPWFAPAGVRRGVVDNASSIGYIDTADGRIFKSIGVTVGLRDTLYENRVNPLTVLPGVGLVAYGQKTRAAMTSAQDRVNVARLIVYLRLVLDKVARPFIFEPNDTITRNQVKSAFEAVLNDVVAKRGLYDYLVVCDDTNNTPDRIDRNELYVDIAIKPVKAIEFVYIPVRILNTGAAL
jgi:Phage tail sheath C-terminal domain